MKEDERIRECAVVRLIVYVLAVVLAAVCCSVWQENKPHSDK